MVVLPGNSFDSDDFDTQDPWGADGSAHWTMDPIVGFASAGTPNSGTNVDNTHGQGEKDDEQEAPEIAIFTVTNPPRTVSVSVLMDGRVDHVELSKRVTWMSESQVASEILVIADLARQKAQSAQYTFILDKMSRLANGDEHRIALLGESVGNVWGLPSPEQVAAAEAGVFATRYSDDCPAQDAESDQW
ncbi:secretion protein EspD [Mycobacterium uberis]|uniref:Secretion protein EspD n=1 Tax=Mycobacterium uberis TaxID=2162698 RepID=A0A3E1HBP9_9MYCO|nr:secretion protein EspD [Mycobacterium uberis]RFD23873.1 secretion protein EspD [Mycobacterium uberis]